MFVVTLYFLDVIWLLNRLGVLGIFCLSRLAAFMTLPCVLCMNSDLSYATIGPQVFPILLLCVCVCDLCVLVLHIKVCKS